MTRNNDHSTDPDRVPSALRGTMEIVRYMGYRIMTSTTPATKGWSAESWVVPMEDPNAQALSAGSVSAPNEAQAVKEAQEQAKVVIELAIEDQALLEDEL